MSAIALRQAFGRAARVLGSRAESTAAAALSSTGPVPSNDPIMRPYYEELARMEVAPAASAREQSPSERAAELALLRLHNLSLSPVYEDGHMIKAKVVEVGRRAVTLDTGLKTARVARADIPPDCILGTTSQNAAPRRPGQLREGDVVQVYLETIGTPEGDFLVSGVQAAVQRRMAAVWKELEERKQRGELVKGRILNAVWKGYAVGVAGVVAFLPARQCARPTARRIGQLQKFRILELDRARSAVILSDPNLHYDGGAAHQREGSFASRRPARSVEEAQRRQELTRVADELRSVLALRNSGDGSSSGGGSSVAAAAAVRKNSS